MMQNNKHHKRAIALLGVLCAVVMMLSPSAQLQVACITADILSTDEQKFVEQHAENTLSTMPKPVPPPVRYRVCRDPDTNQLRYIIDHNPNDPKIVGQPMIMHQIVQRAKTEIPNLNFIAEDTFDQFDSVTETDTLHASAPEAQQPWIVQEILRWFSFSN